MVECFGNTRVQHPTSFQQFNVYVLYNLLLGILVTNQPENQSVKKFDCTAKQKRTNKPLPGEILRDCATKFTL